MKDIGRLLSRRPGHDGWAIRYRGAASPLPWSLCTTREECRETLRVLSTGDLIDTFEVVKVQVRLEVCGVD